MIIWNNELKQFNVNTSRSVIRECKRIMRIGKKYSYNIRIIRTINTLVQELYIIL